MLDTTLSDLMWCVLGAAIIGSFVGPLVLAVACLGVAAVAYANGRRKEDDDAP